MTHLDSDLSSLYISSSSTENNALGSFFLCNIGVLLYANTLYSVGRFLETPKLNPQPKHATSYSDWNYVSTYQINLILNPLHIFMNYKVLWKGMNKANLYDEPKIVNLRTLRQCDRLWQTNHTCASLTLNDEDLDAGSFSTPLSILVDGQGSLRGWGFMGHIGFLGKFLFKTPSDINFDCVNGGGPSGKEDSWPTLH